MKIALQIFGLSVFLGLAACSHGNCYSNKKANSKTEAGSAIVSDSKTIEKVKIAKADGSLQCNQGKKIQASEMQKELGSIKVFSAQNLNDGMMRIQKCGTPTGMHNVYEIDKNDLPAALALGFKEWLAE